MIISGASTRVKVAIIGSGNIGTDLMIKIVRTSPLKEMVALAGIELPLIFHPEAIRASAVMNLPPTLDHPR